MEAISIYERVKYLLEERIDVVKEKSDLSKEESKVLEKEKDLLNKCTKSLHATTKLREELEFAFNQLKEKGIKRRDILKISELTQEFNLDFYDIIIDTFGNDKKTKKALIEVLTKIDNLFNEYDKWIEVDLKVF